MFGPDRCGYEVSRIHAIFNHDGENLLKKDEVKLEYADKNEFTHLYTLIVKPDGTYDIQFDGVSKAKGTLLEGWAFPSKTIDDPTDIKPADWVDEAKIVDPTATKVRVMFLVCLTECDLVEPAGRNSTVPVCVLHALQS